MDYMCRTCMSGTTLKPLFPYEAQFHSFERALFLCTGLRIEHRDGLPQYICKICSKFVESAIRFRNQSQRVEKKLHNLLKVKNKIAENILLCGKRSVENIKVRSHEKEIKIELQESGNASYECESIVDDNEVKHISSTSIDHNQVSVLDNCNIYGVETSSTNKKNSKIHRCTDDKRYLEFIEGQFDRNMPIKCKICKKYLSTLEIFKGHAKVHIGHDLVCEVVLWQEGAFKHDPPTTSASKAWPGAGQQLPLLFLRLQGFGQRADRGS